MKRICRVLLLMCCLYVFSKPVNVSAYSSEYHIIYGYQFHNGKAFMFLTEDYDDYFWAWVDSDFRLILNFKEEFGYENRYLSSYPDSEGNMVLRLNDKEQLVFFDNGNNYTLVPYDKMTIDNPVDGYFTYSKGSSTGYQIQESVYGVMDSGFHVLYEAAEDELISPINDPYSPALERHNNLFVNRGQCVNIDTLQMLNPIEVYGERLQLVTPYGYMVVSYADADEGYIKILDDNGDVLSKFPCDFNLLSYEYDMAVNGNSEYIAISADNKGYIYTKDGTKIFDSESLGNIEVLNISPCENNDFVVLLRGVEPSYNYITVMDCDGHFYFEPIATSVGDKGTYVGNLRDMVYDHKTIDVTDYGEHTVYDFDGNEVFTYSGDFIHFGEGFAFNQTYSRYYDTLGNIYYTVRKPLYDRESELHEYDNFEYFITPTGDITIYSIKEEVTYLEIPETIEGRKVTSIGRRVLWSEKSENDVIHLPASVTNIELSMHMNDTYYNKWEVDDNNPCFSADDDILYDKTKEILYCYPALKQGKVFKIPEGVKSIAPGAFSFSKDSELKELYLPESLERIGERAISLPNLSRIRIPQNVCSISESAFDLCYAMMEFEVAEDNKRFTVDNSSLIDLAGDVMLAYPKGRAETEYHISGSISRIGKCAFRGKRYLKSIVVDEGVLSIGESAFSGCVELDNISLPESILRCERYSFSATELTTIDLGKNVQMIGDYLFSATDMRCVNVGESNPYYYSRDGVLFTADHELIYYPAGKLDIIYYVPEGTTVINQAAFEKVDALEVIYFPKSLTDVEEFAISMCDNITDIYSYMYDEDIINFSLDEDQLHLLSE